MWRTIFWLEFGGLTPSWFWTLALTTLVENCRRRSGSRIVDRFGHVVLHVRPVTMPGCRS